MGDDFKALPQVPGVWCWFDLATSDTAGAKAFYGSLFGWSHATDPIPGGGEYTMLRDAHGPIGGLYGLDAPDSPRPAPPHWQPYVQVASADAAAEQARTLGGEVLSAPFDVLDAGRMAVLRDPEGATFQVWQPKAHPGGALSHRYPGRVCWVELFSRDRERAAAFYTGMFGWDIQAQKDSGYWTYSAAGIPLGGMLDVTPAQFDGVPARWILYFAVADVDAAVARVQALGGSIHMPAQDLPGVGRFAVAADPQHADFTLFRLAPEH